MLRVTYDKGNDVLIIATNIGEMHRSEQSNREVMEWLEKIPNNATVSFEDLDFTADSERVIIKLFRFYERTSTMIDSDLYRRVLKIVLRIYSRWSRRNKA